MKSLILVTAILLTSVARAAVPTQTLPFFSTTDMTPYWPSETAEKRVPAEVSAFQVLNQEGRGISEKNFAAKISLVNFFFTSCPSFCPTMMNSIQGFLKKFPQATADVNLYSFSVQPENDTPKNLKAYAKIHKIDLSRWQLLTGDQKQIFHVGKDMFKADGAVGDQKKADGFIHTRNIYLVDQNRRIRGIYDTGKIESMDLLAKDIETLKYSAR